VVDQDAAGILPTSYSIDEAPELYGPSKDFRCIQGWMKPVQVYSGANWHTDVATDGVREASQSHAFD
jgi:hypothetical protein